MSSNKLQLQTLTRLCQILMLHFKTVAMTGAFVCCPKCGEEYTEKEFGGESAGRAFVCRECGENMAVVVDYSMWGIVCRDGNKKEK
jgi:predicted SprT family Zn-dependent metalloprotease